MKFFSISFILLWQVQSICSPSFAKSKTTNKENIVIFKKVWRKTKENIYDIKRSQKYFTSTRYRTILQQVKKTKNLKELSVIINRFFQTIRISHLGFFTENEIQFYFLKTAFPSSKTIKCWHIGAFFKKKNGNFLVSSLLEKYPASMSGLKKEDKILLANGKVFHPVNSFKKKKSVVLTIERSGVKINIKVKTVHESLHDSFVSATAKSIRIYKMANKQKIGYIHIWALGFRKMFRKVRQIIAKRLKKTDAIIVDLRGGFGGSWIKYIDILCSVKKNNFPGKLDRLGRYTKTKMHPFLFRRKTKAITTPIAVIVDRTTRSGKEFLAHYVQKNKCASVFGEKTAGAFTGARLPIEEDKYILMIPFSEATFGRSKKKLEGIGFTPKNKMSFHPKEELSSVKLKRIFNLLQKKTRAHQKHKRGL